MTKFGEKTLANYGVSGNVIETHCYVLDDHEIFRLLSSK